MSFNRHKRHYSDRRHRSENGLILSTLLILLAAAFLIMAGISVIRERAQMHGTNSGQAQQADALKQEEEKGKEKEAEEAAEEGAEAEAVP